MKVLPYQELFIRQEQALGSSLSNQLLGIAELRPEDEQGIVERLRVPHSIQHLNQ